jgi:hypothetical protein
MKVGNNIKAKQDLQLKPGISLAKLVSVEYLPDTKTKKGPLPCLEFKFVNIPSESDPEERTLRSRVFPIFKYKDLNPDVPKNVTSFEILATKLKHIFSAYAPLPELDVKSYADFFKQYADLFNKIEGYVEKPVWLISCFNGRYQDIPGSALKNFIEPYTQGKPTNLTIDPNLHKLEPEVVGATAAPGAPVPGADMNMGDLPI